MVDWVLFYSKRHPLICIHAADGRNEAALPELNMLPWTPPPQSSSKDQFYYLDVSSKARQAKLGATFTVDPSSSLEAAQLQAKFNEVRCRRGGVRSGSGPGPGESQGQVDVSTRNSPKQEPTLSCS